MYSGTSYEAGAGSTGRRRKRLLNIPARRWRGESNGGRVGLKYKLKEIVLVSKTEKDEEKKGRSREERELK